MYTGIKNTPWLVGLIKRLVNNIVQSLKPVCGEKPLGKVMLASNTSKKLLRNTTDEGNLIQLELNFR